MYQSISTAQANSPRFWPRCHGPGNHPVSAIGLTVLLITGQSHAVPFKVQGERGGYWESVLFLNYIHAETLSFENNAEANIESNTGWGIGVHYNADNHWNFGLDLSFNRPGIQTRFLDPRSDEYVTTNHTTSRFDGQLNLQYNILRGTITPYLQAGLGLTFMDSNIVDNLDSYCSSDDFSSICRSYANTFEDSAFSHNFGLGLRWDLSDLLFVRGAYIRQWVHTEGDPAPATARLEIGMFF